MYQRENTDLVSSPVAHLPWTHVISLLCLRAGRTVEAPPLPLVSAHSQQSCQINLPPPSFLSRVHQPPGECFVGKTSQQTTDGRLVSAGALRGSRRHWGWPGRWPLGCARYFLEELGLLAGKTYWQQEMDFWINLLIKLAWREASHYLLLLRQMDPNSVFSIIIFRCMRHWDPSRSLASFR